MACIIKLPSQDSKGVVSFTTQEERVIRAFPKRLEALRKLKEKYVICLHYNWHNFNCKPDQLFDIHLAGEEDLKITNGESIYQIPMDACNFVRPEYQSENIKKTWNILFVGNPVFFKDPISFLRAMRELYDQKKFYRALYICPLPNFKWSDRKTVVYKIRKIYDSLFNQAEQQLFNHLIIRENYPRFFDRQTLACFYKNSEIFVHTAPDERRCRVAAYAWASRMPVVGKECVGSLLPKHLRKPPFFYEVSSLGNYSTQIENALKNIDKVKQNSSWDEVENEFLTQRSVLKLESFLKKYFNKSNLPYNGKILCNNLDQRLGWHHGFGISTNTCNQNLDTFLAKIMSLNENTHIGLIKEEYPEEALIDNEFLKGKEDLNYIPIGYKVKSFINKIIFFTYRVRNKVKRVMGVSP